MSKLPTRHARLFELCRQPAGVDGASPAQVALVEQDDLDDFTADQLRNSAIASLKSARRHKRLEGSLTLPLSVG